MDDSQFEHVKTHYNGLVKKHGHSYRSCDWGSKEAQTKRFQILTGVCPLDGLNVLDVGCGPADLCDYIEEIFTKVRYSGIDVTPAMVELAKRRRPDIAFGLGSILTLPHLSAEVVFASGIFTFLQGDRRTQMEQQIGAMFAACSVALAFNSLSTYAENQEAGEFYANPLEVFAFCKTLTPWVVLRHDYHPGDFTIYMYKEQH